MPVLPGCSAGWHVVHGVRRGQAAVTVYVLDVRALWRALEARREVLGLSLGEVAAAARVPADALSAVAAGAVPSQVDAGQLLLWLGWQPELAQRLVGGAF